MNLDRILTSTPINGTAARVVAQGHKTDEGDIDRIELQVLVDRLQRKHRLMKHILRVTTASQHRNLMRKYNLGRRQKRARIEPRIFKEYVRVGPAIQILVQRIAELRKAELPHLQMAHAEHDAWWDGLTPEQQAAERQRAFLEKQARKQARAAV